MLRHQIIKVGGLFVGGHVLAATPDPKYSEFRFKTFQKEIKFKMFNFGIFKGFLILTELGELGKLN